MTGKKNDQDNYEKVDYSLVPIELIESYLNYKVYGNAPAMDIIKNKDYQLFNAIHILLNNPKSIAEHIPLIFNSVLSDYGIKNLALSLGFGFSKYKERDNWKKFDSDPERFLRATLRHLMSIMLGDHYDNEGIEGYSKGNDHRGAVCFTLMVVDNIIKNTTIKR